MQDMVVTERLRLRELQPDDLDALLEVLGDPLAMRYYPAPFDRGGVAAWIEWARQSYREMGSDCGP
jgi:RimJ/RimL family protein N-acetyltransferase